MADQLEYDTIESTSNAYRKYKFNLVYLSNSIRLYNCCYIVQRQTPNATNRFVGETADQFGYDTIESTSDANSKYNVSTVHLSNMSN